MKDQKRYAAYFLGLIVLIFSLIWFTKKAPNPLVQPDEPSAYRETLGQNMEPPTKEITEEPEIPSDSIVDAFFESDKSYSGSSSVEEHDHIIREWRGTLNPSPEELRERLSSSDPGDKFTISLPLLGQTELTITKTGAIGAGRAVVRASYGSENMSSTVIAFVGDAISMAISDPGNRREYSLRNGSHGFQFVSEIDLEVAMVCQTCVENLNPSARP